MRSRSLRDAAGEVTTFLYDALGRVARKSLPGAVYDYGYDLAGRLKTVSAPEGNYRNLYDSAGRLSVASDAGGRALYYRYDANSNRSRLTWPDLATYVTYDYDQLNRLTAIRENGAASLVSYGYDALSRLTSVTHGNGAVMAFSYEIDDALAQVTQSFSGSTMTHGYRRNRAGQVTGRTVSGLAPWRPDADDTTSYAPGLLNLYDSVEGAAYGYDAKGNLTDDGTDAYLYDAENRLVQASTAAALSNRPVLAA